MAYHTMESTTDAAERAGEYVSGQVAYLSDRARDVARAARDRIQDYAGESAEVWSDVREYVRTHPLQMLGILVGVGYILGKVTMRSSFRHSSR